MPSTANCSDTITIKLYTIAEPAGGAVEYGDGTTIITFGGQSG
jgi:hypothetical protein